MPNDAIEVNEYLAPEQPVDFRFADPVPAHESSKRRNFVTCVVINVKTWILFPPFAEPANKISKCGSFLGNAVSPPVMKFQRSIVPIAGAE